VNNSDRGRRIATFRLSGVLDYSFDRFDVFNYRNETTEECREDGFVSNCPVTIGGLRTIDSESLKATNAWEIPRDDKWQSKLIFLLSCFFLLILDR
jgi:hypothetical protein